MLKLIDKKVFLSWNAGLNSTERKNLKRVSKVLDSLAEISSGNVKTETDMFFQNLRVLIIDYMKEAGFNAQLNNKDNYCFKKIK